VRVGNELELAPDGGAAAFAVRPGVFLVGYDAPVLFVLGVVGVFVDCGKGAVSWDAACGIVLVVCRLS
jgi:hypothetical protein